MSKLRPSAPGPAQVLPQPLSAPRRLSQAWLKRVFHNTYTRNGKRRAVRGWSVKIQHQGRRRSFSLLARTRFAAAAEAQALYQRLLVEGWEIAQHPDQRTNGGAFPKTDIRHWKERLLLRKFRFSAASRPGPEFSARIEHAGTASYFPLGLADTDAAAAKAVKIYRTALERGWETALRTFPREACIAFHWASVPLLWTYTTLHTIPESLGTPSNTHVGKAPAKQCFLLVEADTAIRRALTARIECQPGWTCIHVPTASEAQLHYSRATFCLVNSDLQEQMGLPTRSSLATLSLNVPALTYSVHADSDEVFAGSPGGISSYLFIRLPPHRLLEPAHAALNNGPASLESLRRAAQSYFQMAVQIPSDAPPAPVAARLTQREKEVLSLLGKGCIDKEIAHALGISAWTVHGHVKRLFKKLHVHSRLEAVLAYLQK